MTEQEKHQQLIESYEAHETNETREPREVYVLMRFIGFMWLVSLGLISCSSEQLDEPVDAVRAIAFSADMPEEEPVTRSTPLETESNTFRVWSYKNTSKVGDNYAGAQAVIGGSGYVVSWTANTAGTTTSNSYDWEYVNGTTQYIKYWDFSAEAYRFFAYAPENATGVTAGYVANETYGASDAYEAYELSFAVDAAAPDDAPYFSELWFSNNVTSVYGQPVTLRFIRPYVRVRFMFTQTDENAVFNLTDISLHPQTVGDKIATKGTFTVIYPLTGSGTKELFRTSGIDESASLTGLTHYYVPTTDEYWYTLLPAASQDNYELSLKLNGEDRTAVVPSQYMTWKPNFQYTYVFKITDQGGVILDHVHVAFTPLTDNEEDYEVYNW